jgi:hypothetical protein
MGQRPGRQPVGGDVVDHQEQDVLSLPQAEQPGPHGRLASEIETGPCDHGQPIVKSSLVDGLQIPTEN